MRARPPILALLGLSLFGPLAAHARLVEAVTGYRMDDSAAHPPLLLSETGLYLRPAAIGSAVRAPSPAVDPASLSDSIYPFSVNVPFWSDGAAKERFICVPFGRKITPSDSAPYVFPESTVFIKTFALDTIAGDSSSRIRIETRFLVFRTHYGYPYFSGLSYRWRRDQSDADLVPPKTGEDALIPVRAGGQAKGLRWRFPSQIECNRCHVPEYRGALGFLTPQLNRPSPGNPAINQLQDLFEKGLLASNPIQGKPSAFRWHGWDDSSAGLEARARSYLAANCSQCHGNSYKNHSVINFDYFDSSQAIAYSPENYEGYVGRPKPGDSITPQFVYPGRPDSSYLLLRMLSRGTPEALSPEQMPPLASYRADSAGVRGLRDWICGMPGATADTVSCTLPFADAADGYADAAVPGAHSGLARLGGFKAVLRGRELRVLSREPGGPDPRLYDAGGRRVRLWRVGPGRYIVAGRPRRGILYLQAQGRVIRLEYPE